ncbi:MAG: SufE family protein, partial [Chloroflexaceae bacterium]
MTETSAIPPRLQAIIEEFKGCDRNEKLELMLEYADRLPPLPEHLRGRAGMEQVDECASPVFLHTERQGEGLVFHFDV